MNKIKEIYKNDTFEIQIKAPMMHVVLWCFFGLSFLVIASDAFSNALLLDYLEHSLLVLITLAAILLLRKGKIHWVSNVYFSLMTFLFIVLRFTNGTSGDSTLPFLTAIVGAFLVFSSVFIENLKVLKGLVILYALSYFAMIANLQITGGWQTDRISAAIQIVYTSISMISICISILMIRNVFNKVMMASEEKMNQLKAYSEKIKILITESADQLGKAGQLQMEADGALAISENMQKQTDMLKTDLVNLNTRLENSNQALNVVDQAIDELHHISEDQSAQVTESSASIEEMAASINNVSQIVQSKTQAVQELKAEADQGETTMTHTRGAFAKAHDLLGEIKDVTSLISGIAAQTNLLAMNAAIEAAHAGDSGRGFAVVASEIRKLAESSSQNAKRITETIKEMVKAIEQTGEQVDQSGQAFQRIARGIGQVGTSMNEIYRSTDELNTGSREILTSVSHLNETTRKVLDQVDQVAQSSEKVNQDLQEIRNISEDTGSISKSSSEESLRLKQTSETMQLLCRELLEQSIKLNAAMTEEGT